MNPEPSFPLAPTQPAQGQGAIGLPELILVLRRWWWKCSLAGTVLAAVAMAVVWHFFVPVYEASAWLQIKEKPVIVAFEHYGDSRAFSETQLQTIKSPVVLSKVASQPEIARVAEAQGFDDPHDWLKKGMKVGLEGRSELCKLSFAAHESKTSADVANSILDAYMSLHSHAMGAETERIIELLKEERSRRGEEVKQHQERVRMLTKTATEDDPLLMHHEMQVLVPQNPLTNLEDRRAAAEVERTVLEAKLKAAEEAADDGEGEVSESELAWTLDQHPEVVQIKNQLNLLRQRLVEHKRRARDQKDASATRMTQEIADLEAGLKTTQAELRPRLIEQVLSAKEAERADIIADFKTNIENQQLAEKIWADRIDEQRKKIEKLGDKSVDLEFARAEMTRAQDVHDRISDRIVMLQTEMGAPSQVSALHRAVPPARPKEWVPLKKLGVAGLGGFCIPFALAFLWERLVRRIHDVKQLSHEVNLPVLGEITVLPTHYSAATRLKDGRFLRERVTYEESIDALRVALMLSPNFRDLRTLVVTSSVSREGKTSLASALAVSIAKCSGEPTLLIDGDMRCPSLHEIFGTQLGPGLVDVLGQQATLNESIIVNASQAVHFLPAGQLKMSPHVMLQKGAWVRLLTEVKSHYRYVVIDAPPVLAASEAIQLASEADGALVCTMRDVSRGPQFRVTCDRLAAAGARVLGTVISGLPVRTWAYKYGGYGYGYERYLGYRRVDFYQGPPPPPVNTDDTRVIDVDKDQANGERQSPD